MMDMFFNYDKQPGLSKDKKKQSDVNMPLISIITPFYNAQKFFNQTFNSVMNQTFPFWEWIIINDNSTEKGTEAFLDNKAKKDKRLIVINNKENKGPSESRMLGIKKAKTDYIFFLDADDLIDETMLECSYWCLKTNPNAAWAYANTIGFGSKQYLWNVPFDTLLEKSENLLCITSLIKKEALLKAGGFNTVQKNYHEDWALWLKLLSMGYKPAQMNFYGFWYRRGENRMASIDNNQRLKKESQLIIKEYAKQVKNDIEGLVFPNVESNDYDLKYSDWDNNLTVPLKKDPLIILTDTISPKMLNKLDLDKDQPILISTKIDNYETRQQLEEKAIIYDLSSFLTINNWLSFINYIINSKGVKRIIYDNHNSYFTKIISLLLNKNVEIKIRDINHHDYQEVEDIEKYKNDYLEYLKTNSKVSKRTTKQKFIFRFGRKMWKYKWYRSFISIIKKFKEVFKHGK